MFAEDLSVYFDATSGFAVNATVGSATVPVIFDAVGQPALAGFVETAGPQCIAKSQDVATVVQGTAITINAVAYTVTGVEPDGNGVTTLQLRKA
jgi:hypothetical protein